MPSNQSLDPSKRNSPESNLRRVDPQSRITLPPDVRSALQLERDDLVGFEITDDGRVWLRKARIVFDAGGHGG